MRRGAHQMLLRSPALFAADSSRCNRHTGRRAKQPGPSSLAVREIFSGQRSSCGSVEHFTVDTEARAVTRTIPGRRGGVEPYEATQVRAYARDSVEHALWVPIDRRARLERCSKPSSGSARLARQPSERERGASHFPRKRARTASSARRSNGFSRNVFGTPATNWRAL